MSAAFARARRHAPVASRVVAAIVGGYALGALSSVAALALPMSATQGVVTGMLASFVVYTGAVIWVFLARSATRAWAGLALVAAPLALAAWWASSVASATNHAASHLASTASAATKAQEGKPQ
ncbi:DUF3649 domain-containing protein [Paraburkholderia acidisoli]|uniref:DUF3649 domain-containing protein n=1 Tax=Paraburkholderia acidisoli TaxID=2571748 RepID=A0A7Z2JGY8_9BURK|nr:DUF3649 domain-containing protein [Paraburkholderia acidisoli]